MSDELPNEHELNLATLAYQALADWKAQHVDPPSSLTFHPGDLTERLLLSGAMLHGVEVLDSEHVDPGTVEVA